MKKIKLSKSEKSVLYNLLCNNAKNGEKKCVLRSAELQLQNAIESLVAKGILRQHDVYTNRFVLVEGVSVYEVTKEGQHMLARIHPYNKDIQVVKKQ